MPVDVLGVFEWTPLQLVMEIEINEMSTVKTHLSASCKSLFVLLRASTGILLASKNLSLGESIISLQKSHKAEQ